MPRLVALMPRAVPRLRPGSGLAMLAAAAAVVFALTLARADDAHAQLLGGCGGLFQPRCPPPQCADAKDNDKDAVQDLADPGCSSREDTSEWEDVAPDINGDPVPGPDVDPRGTDKLMGFNTHLSQWDRPPPAPSSGITTPQEAALIRAVGGNAQRFSVQWSVVEPTRGAWETSQLEWQDRMYVELRAHAMTPIITVLQAPAWASDYANCFILDLNCRDKARRADHLPPRDISAYAAFVRRIAQRYPEAAIETWNEPNIRGYWTSDPFPNAGRMAAMQCAAYDAVRSSNPAQRVIAPGLAWIGSFGSAPRQYPYLEFTRALYKGMGGRTCWDALGVHVYPSSDVDGDGSSTAEAFRVIRNLQREFDDTSPIWVTETGASTSGTAVGDHGHTGRSPEEQRRMMRAAVNELLTTSDVGAVMIHSLRDRAGFDVGGTDRGEVEYGFGLLLEGPGPTPPPKPSWCHFVGVVGGSYPGC